MKKILLIVSLAGSIAVMAAACGSGGGGSGSGSERNMNSGNRTGNSGMNTGANTSMNTAGNTANTMGNTAAQMTMPSPADFMHEAAESGMAEVEMGRLAAKKAQNAEVKKFGQMMVTDHSKANEELKGIATKKNIALPADAASHKSDMDMLNKAAGADFDRSYVDMMVDEHMKDVEAFQKQAEGSTDPDVKAFAAKTLPTLKKHLDTIRAIQSKM
jgi:putative membrane protein